MAQTEGEDPKFWSDEVLVERFRSAAAIVGSLDYIRISMGPSSEWGKKQIAQKEELKQVLLERLRSRNARIIELSNVPVDDPDNMC